MAHEFNLKASDGTLTPYGFGMTAEQKEAAIRASGTLASGHYSLCIVDASDASHEVCSATVSATPNPMSMPDQLDYWIACFGVFPEPAVVEAASNDANNNDAETNVNETVAPIRIAYVPALTKDDPAVVASSILPSDKVPLFAGPNFDLANVTASELAKYFKPRKQALDKETGTGAPYAPGKFKLQSGVDGGANPYNQASAPVYRVTLPAGTDLCCWAEARLLYRTGHQGSPNWGRDGHWGRLISADVHLEHLIHASAAGSWIGIGEMGARGAAQYSVEARAPAPVNNNNNSDSAGTHFELRFTDWNNPASDNLQNWRLLAVTLLEG